MKNETEMQDTHPDIDYTDSRWVATTTGQFLQILIDSGQDPCVIFRVDEDMRITDDNSFVRRMTVFSIPNGSVNAMLNVLTIADSDRHVIYKGLQALLEAGLIT